MTVEYLKVLVIHYMQIVINMKLEGVYKNFVPLAGGLAIGDGIARIVEHDMTGIIEISIASIALAYLFYLIFRK